MMAERITRSFRVALSRRNLFAVILGFAPFAQPAPSVTVQQVREIEVSNRVCSGCSVTATRVVTIDGRNSPLFEWPPGAIAQDSKKRFVLLSELGALPGRMPQLFDAQDRFLRDIARQGQGPGELNRPTWVDVGSGDTLRVYERSRVSVYSSSLTFIRRDTIVPPFSSVRALMRLPGGSVISVENGQVILRGGGGRILRQLRFDTLFFWGSKRVAADLTGATPRLWITLQQDTIAGYHILQMDTAGRVLKRYGRKPVNWRTQGPYPPWDPATMARPIRPEFFPRPTTSIADLRYESDGLLRILVSGPKPDWHNVKEEDRWAST